MDVKQPGIVLGSAARHHRADVGLVEALVLGEAHVAVDAEQRRLAVALQRDFRFAKAAERSSTRSPIGVFRSFS